MPNQRKKGKKMVAVWLSETERQLIEQMVADGVVTSKSDLFKAAILARATEKGYTKKGKRDGEYCV